MNGYTTTCCIYNLHHPIEPSKLPFNWIHILDSQIFFDALCICAVLWPYTIILGTAVGICMGIWPYRGRICIETVFGHCTCRGVNPCIDSKFVFGLYLVVNYGRCSDVDVFRKAGVSNVSGMSGMCVPIWKSMLKLKILVLLYLLDLLVLFTLFSIETTHF